MDKRWLWIGGLALGALTIGGIAYAASGPSSAAGSGGGTLPPLPGGNAQPTTPGRTIPSPKVTDPVTPDMVSNLQMTLAELIAGGFVPGAIAPPLNLPLYTPQDVDGNAQNPKFVGALQVFQKMLAAQGVRINTAGVLDFGTGSVLLVDWVVRNGYVQTPAVTDPALLAMGQAALLAQPIPVGSFPVDGTPNAAFTAALASYEQGLAHGVSQMQGARTDGTLDYLTLAWLLVRAYMAP